MKGFSSGSRGREPTSKTDPAYSGSIGGACSLETNGRPVSLPHVLFFRRFPSDRIANAHQHTPTPDNVNTDEGGITADVLPKLAGTRSSTPFHGAGDVRVAGVREYLWRSCENWIAVG